MMMNSWQSLRLLLLGVAWTGLLVDRSAAFVVPMSHYHRHHPLSITGRKYIGKASLGTLSESEANNNEPDVKFSRGVPESSTTNLDAKSQTAKRPADGSAATNTVNERLMAELKAAEDKEKYGSRTSAGKKLGIVDGFGRPRKTDEEVKAAIEAARDLNGVNPVVALLGSFFALGVAGGLWYATKELGIFFALHPVDTEVYFLVRSSQVVRNIAMGLMSLASGFFGVTGLGIFLLGVRVAYGVITGELDPTPIKQTQKGKVEMPNMLDLMLNKKPNRRGGRDGNDDNPFGI